MYSLASSFIFDTEYQATVADLVYNDQIGFDTMRDLATLHDVIFYANTCKDELRLLLLNWAIGGCGVEYDYEHEVHFINMGDTYVQTIITEAYDTFIIANMSDYIESLPQILTGLAGCYMPDTTAYLTRSTDAVEAFKESCIDYFIFDDDTNEDDLAISDLEEEIEKLIDIAKMYKRNAVSYNRNSYSVELHLNGSNWPE